MTELLNNPGSLTRPRTAPCTPEVVITVVGEGRCVHLDCNSLTAALCSSGERPLRGIAARFAPGPPPAAPEAPSALTLVVTTRCNLRCRYCYVDKDGRDMSVVTVLRALNLLDPDPAAPRQINFFGGEPLLNWEAVRAAMNVARSRREDTTFGLTTNATLLTPEIAADLAAFGVGLIVSLDGPPDVHDAARDGSWERAMIGLDAARGAGLGPRTTLRATFDRSPARLVERLEYLNGLCDVGYASGVSVEPSLYGDAPKAADVADEYRAAGDWFVERIKAGDAARFKHLSQPLRRLLNREYAVTECGAGAGYLAVDPDGAIWPCHTLRGAALGHVNEPDVFRLRQALDPRLYVWRFYGIHSQPGCMACWARFLCGGGCRVNRSAAYCEYVRMWLTEAIRVAARLTAAERRAFA